MTVIETAGALRGATSGRVWLEQGEAGARLLGWAMAEPTLPGEAPEITVQAAGLGLRSFGTEPPAAGTSGGMTPDGAHPFAWPLPSALRDGSRRVLHIWNLATGQELAGSPVMVPAGPAASTARSVPLARWDAPLAGHVSAGEAVELAAGLWVAAEPPARTLRYELAFAEAVAPGEPPARGIRILTDAASARIALHYPLAPLLAEVGCETPVTVQVSAWLPQATQRAMQAQAELWLLALRDGRFEKLRRLRRVRIFRRPSLLTAQLTHGAEDGPADTLWLGIEALQAKGLAALPPRLARAVEPITDGMEDARLHGAFDALGELVRVHGEAAMASHPLLPAMPPPAPVPPVAADAHP
ncbi:MAG: hypothetical protein V4653_07160, partial [Pseudomonadota bacterium]